MIPAFWRAHPFHPKFPDLAWTRGIGLQASTWIAGAFMNSHDGLSVIAGVERAWLARNTGSLGFGLGYRAGLVTGYDKRLLAVAETVPALPFAGLLTWLQLRRLSLDAFYVYHAVTVEASFGF